MKRIIFAVTPLMFLSYLAACPPPDPKNPAAKYAPGYTTLNIARMVITNAYSSFISYEFDLRRGCNIKICVKVHPDKKSRDYLKCIYRDHGAEAEFKSCYGKMVDFRPLITRVAPLALALIDSSRVALDFAVKYELAKAADKASSEGPTALKEFCGHAYPMKQGSKYRDCLAGKPLERADWYTLLKSGACIIYNAVAFVPSEYEVYVGPIRTWAKAIGDCK